MHLHMYFCTAVKYEYLSTNAYQDVHITTQQTISLLQFVWQIFVLTGYGIKLNILTNEGTFNIMHLNI